MSRFVIYTASVLYITPAWQALKGVVEERKKEGDWEERRTRRNPSPHFFLPSPPHFAPTTQAM